MTKTLPAIDLGIEPLRMIGRYRAVEAYTVAFRAAPGEDYFATPLTPASFMSGPSDYEMPSDELYCPCGVTLDWPDGNLGTAIEIADEHIVEAHPEATAKARAKRKREAAKLAAQCDVYPSLACSPKREQCQVHCVRNGAPS